MFAAGLTLGFPLFVEGPDSEIEGGLDQTQAVLQHFSALSPQARHYHEILQAFNGAISLHQQKFILERTRSNGLYMDDMFQASLKDVATGSDVSQETSSSLISSNGLSAGQHGGILEDDFSIYGNFDFNSVPDFAGIDIEFSIP